MTKENQSEKGIFINGRQQVIDLLRVLSPEEKRRILRGIRLKNPQLARELSESSLSFENLYDFPEDSLRKVFSNVETTLSALALKLSPDHFQRKVLRSLRRNQAEEIFNLIQRIPLNKKGACEKAQERVLQVVATLHRKQLIQVH